MKFNYLFIIVFMLIAFICENCHKEVNDPQDNIVFTNLPDTLLSYSYTKKDSIDIRCIVKTGAFNYHIDLNNDSLDDYEIQGTIYPGLYNVHDYCRVQNYKSYIVSLNENAFIGFADSSQARSFEYGGVKINDKIDNKLIWSNQKLMLYIDIDDVPFGTLYTWYDSTDKFFIPVMIQEKESKFYGWIDLVGDKNPAVIGFAINMTPNKPILAGQIQ